MAGAQDHLAAKQDRVSDEQAAVAAQQDRVAAKQAALAGDPTSTIDTTLRVPQQVMVYNLSPESVPGVVAVSNQLRLRHPGMGWALFKGTSGIIDTYRAPQALREQVRHDIEQSYLDLGIPELRVMFNPGREQLALIDRGSPAASEVAQTVTTMEDLHRERTQLEALKRQKAELDLHLREAERANQMWA